MPAAADPLVRAYYESAPSPQKETLLIMRKRILEVIPAAIEKIKYQMPTFELAGEDICGLMAHKKHVGFYPYSGSVLELLPEITSRFSSTKGALHVPIDAPLSKTDIGKLIRVRRSLLKG